MKFRKAFLFLSAPALVISQLITVSAPTACSDSKNTSQLEPVVLGASAALTGSQPTFGMRSRLAMQLAAAHVNALGGVLGRPLELDLRDDVSADDQAKAAAEYFFTKRPNFVGMIGPSTGFDTLLERFEAEKTILLSPFSTAPLITSRSASDASLDGAVSGVSRKYSLRHSCLARPQLIALARLAYGGVIPLVRQATMDAGTQPVDAGADATVTPPADPPGTTRINNACKRVFLANIDGEGGTGNTSASIFTKELTSLGGTVVKQEKLPDPRNGGSPAYGAIAQSISDLNADCLVMLLPPEPAGTLMREVRNIPKLGSLQAFGSIPLFQETFIKAGRVDPAATSGSTAAEGVIVTACNTTPETPEGATFRNLYATYYPTEDLAQSIPQAFDAVIMMALAVEAAKTTTDREKLRQSLLDISSGGRQVGPGNLSEAFSAIRQGIDIDYQGAAGPCDFNKELDTTLELKLWKVANASFSAVSAISATQVSEQ